MFLRYTECQLEEGSSVGFVCRGMVQVASGLFYGVKEIRGFAETLVSSTEGKAVPPAKSKYNEQRLEKLEVVAVKMMGGYSITLPNATTNTMGTTEPGHKLKIDKTLSQKLKRSLGT